MSLFNKMTKPQSDTGICVICKKPYPKVKNGSNIRKRGKIRKRNSVTCSHKCSGIYWINRKDYVKEAKINKKEIKEKIELMEYYLNGFNKLSGYKIKVSHIRFHKKDNSVIADVTVITEGERLKYYDCEYSIDKLNEFNEKLKNDKSI